MFTTESINMASHTSALIVTCMLLMGVLMDGNVKKRIYRCFFALILLNLIGILSEFTMVFLMMAGMPPSGAPIILFDFLSYLTGPLQNIAFALYLYEFLGTKTNLSRTPFYLSALLSVISVITLVLVQTRGLYGVFGEGYAYERGEMYTIYFLTSALFLIVFIYIALRYGGGLRKRERLALLSYPLIAFVGHAIEGILSTIWVSYLGISLILFIIYINIQGELKQQLIRKDAELADQRITVMLSQIQPHFLYNALNTIGDLCITDPEQAQETVFEFADYMRVNMDSLTISGLVPFEQELGHVKTYLALEQKRFVDRLRVEYDIQANDFELPPLTIQPIVENAVLHGITVSYRMGTVLIRTQETAEGVKITITDDGVGFDPAVPLVDGKTHLGIDNVKRRLESVCGGSLTVNSTPGNGTTATIFIPHRGVEK